jgi:multiple sugar transport system ATP-binding protein
MATIELTGVTKRYPDGTEAVSGLDLSIGDGEFMIFVGPSGCGKSTALRMLAGLEEISAGDVLIDGTVVTDRSPKERDIAMVFQTYALYPHMTVAENMGFALKLAKRPKHEIAEKVRRAAQVLDLVEQLERKPANLSGGQRQRVAMGRAIVREPKAFLMDEPLSNLDAKLRVQMRAQIARLQHQLGTTTVYVTHDQTEAMTLGDRVAVLRGGVLQQVAPPQELYDAPANLFVAGFIGSPAMSFLAGELADGAVRTSIGAIPLAEGALGDGAPRGRELVVGIRPEDLDDPADVRPGARVHAFDARIDLVESVGSDLFAHFDVDGARARELDELAAAGGEAADGRLPGDGRAVARLAPTSRVRAGETARLFVDTAKIHLFDAADGRALGRAAAPALAAAPPLAPAAPQAG